LQIEKASFGLMGIIGEGQIVLERLMVEINIRSVSAHLLLEYAVDLDLLLSVDATFHYNLKTEDAYTRFYCVKGHSVIFVGSVGA
jgi:hypothetical protein